MTVSTSAAAVTLLGNGSTTSWSINFIMYSAADIQISYYNGSTLTILNSIQYTLSLNAPASNQLYGIGGSLVYPITGSPIANGTYLIVQRIVPYVQLTSILNQGNFSPQVIEQMGDNLEFQLQQLASRTTQFRGIWQTGIAYNFGDIVQDGPNGADTLNYYICTSANTSGIWATDLAAGDWAISVLAVVPSGTINLTGAVTGTQVGASIATTLANNIVGTANLQNLAVTTAIIAAQSVTYAKFQNASAGNVVLGNPTASAGAYSEIGIGLSQLFGRGASGNLTPITLGTGLSMSSATLNATGGSELVLLGTATASNSASLTFTSLISSAYDYYFFVLKDINLSSAALWIRGSTNNGSIWINAGNYNVNLSAHIVNATTITVTAQAGVSQWGLVTSNTSPNVNGKIDLPNPLGANPNAFWHLYDNAIDAYYEGYSQFNGGNNFNAIQFLASSGNIISGTIEMYGVKNT